jgi:glutathione S-transferase
MAYQLIIGNKNYSSWSLRAWILMRHCGLEFEEQRLAFFSPEFKSIVPSYSPSGKVPVLVDGDIRVWDSMSISEYIAEKHPELNLWPQDIALRAVARSVCAEMHAGFMGLRNNMPLNCRGDLPGKGRTQETKHDIARIIAIWEDCRKRYADAGPFLFGHFTIADATYAPVVLRFRTYGVELPAQSQAYADHLQALPAMQEWTAAARSEPETILQFEPYA